MQFKIVENLLFPSHIRNGVANSICFLHRIKKQVSLFVSRQKFYFQYQLHVANIVILSDIRKYCLTKGGVAFLPSTPKGDEWVSATVL